MRKPVYRTLKRALDIIVALTALVLLAPILLLIALAVRINLGSPVLFRQTRGGLHGRIFHIVKFRTMRDAIDTHGRPLPDSERLTPFGKLLRGASLDELPELWNVLVGHMSIVGPRPFMSEYLALYSPAQARRHDVRPGITGWAQVNGRNSLSWEERFDLDLWYVDHGSLWLDFKIVLMTVVKVLSREDVSAAGEATMKKFTGTKQQDVALAKAVSAAPAEAR